MCGIAGLLVSKEEPRDQQISAAILRMLATLSSRGPDGSGVFVEENVALGHNRLSILDLSQAGAQPMRLGTDGPVITFNGEVYNFNDLRQKLLHLGHKDWRGHSDTEVILRVYAEWGLEGLKLLEGMFALALWDPVNRRLVLMRDRFGGKPLFYGECRYGFAFGSEIKALLAAGGVDTDLHDQAFSEYLWYGNTHCDRTFYRSLVDH